MLTPASSAPSPRHRVVALLLGGLLVHACASTPRPVGPTSIAAPVPPPETGAAASGADRVPDAPDGPVLLEEPRLTWTHVSDTGAAYEWRVVVRNPSSRTLELTLVVQILDPDGRPLDHHGETFLLGGDERLPRSGTGEILREEIARADSWQVDYWVRVPPPPERRISR